MVNYGEERILGNGRYELQRILGQGTYGVVWLANDTQLQIHAAIKRLHPNMGKISDLQREAVTQARLNHPNVATIYSADIDGRFIAMEYVEGESLEKCLKTHISNGTWINIEKSRQILSQCFDALRYAHGENVIHGDIKPGNIMIHSNETVKLTDFGVAKVISERELAAYSYGEQRRLGSITYMAPEVIMGEPRDFRSDIFSLGIMAYVLFTGNHPFRHPHPSGIFSIEDMILSDEEPRKPSDVQPSIQESFERVIMKMMAKSPEDRYANINQAYEELFGFGLTCPKCGSSNPASAHYCMKCGHSLQEAKDDQYKDRTPRELWSRAFQLNSELKYEEAIKLCNEAVKMQPDFAEAYQTKGFALSNLRAYNEALDCFTLALKYAKDRLKKADIHVNISYVYFKQGDYERNVAELRKALELNPYHPKARTLMEKYGGQWESRTLDL